ncbi:MAG: glycosyltransferase [Candidatus Brocadiaceae bacterium]|nr:glycosyltransferase [Candidatus Brocadiaceae bacterium]
MTTANKKLSHKYNIAYLMHGARNVGGGEYNISFLIKGLNRDIFEPLVFFSHENEIIRNLRSESVITIKVPLHKKITSVYRDEIKANPFHLLIYAFYLSVGILEMVRLLKSYRIDILHPHDNLSKIIGGIAAKIGGVKTITHCNDLLTNGVIEKGLIWYQLLFMDRIIAVSESVKNLFEMRKLGHGKVCTIYNGIDLGRFDTTIDSSLSEMVSMKDENIVIGIIAVFDACKGHLYLFQAIEKLVSDGIKNIVCLVIGDGRINKELKRLVSEKKLERYIKFLGYRKDIPILLKSIDIVVAPSIQESFGMAPLEAMAMNVPVVATRVGGLAELVEDGKTGILVSPGDVNSLSEAIKYLIESPSTRKKMGKAGRKRVEERFRIENNVRKTEALYLEVLLSHKNNRKGVGITN